MAIRRKFRARRGMRTVAPAPSVKQAAVKANLERFREMTARITPLGTAPPPAPGPNPGSAQPKAALVGEVLPAERSNGSATVLRRARRAGFTVADAGPEEDAAPSLQQARQQVTRSLLEARQMMLGAEGMLREAAGSEGSEELEDGGFQERMRSVAAAHETAAEAQRLAELATAMVAHTNEALDEAAVLAAQGVQHTMISMIERTEDAAQMLSGAARA